MKLSEKIYICRKRSGRSQEELAEALNVSRQAISKWETGEAEPELRKLQLLAKTFDVSIDWLLSEEDAMPKQETGSSAQPAPEAQSATVPKWLGNLPGAMKRFVMRYGYLAGIYVAVIGLLFLLLGGFAYGMATSMIHSHQTNFFPSSDVQSGIGSGLAGSGWITLPELESSQQPSSFGNLSRPMFILTAGIMTFGGILVILGVLLSVFLRRYGRKKLNESPVK